MSFKIFINTLLKHLGIIFVVSLVLIILVIIGLNSYTQHGEYILVPQLHGLDGDSLVENSDENFLKYSVIDSIYDAENRPGAVSRQNPMVGAKVKKGRKIYLTTVTKGREFIPMPNLVDLTIRRAIDVIYNSRLKVNQLIFIDNFARNAVLSQLIRQDTIAPETPVLIGTAINLVVGNGHNPGGVRPPFLIGKTAEEAREIIYKSSLNFGGADTIFSASKENLRVFKQFPSSFQKESVFLGNEMRITIRSADDFDFDSIVNRPHNVDYEVDQALSDSLSSESDMEEF